MTELHNCYVCKKPICDDEYVVNWGSCGPCLDESFSYYMRKERRRYVRQRVLVWGSATAITTGLFLGGGKLVGIVLYYLSHAGQ